MIRQHSRVRETASPANVIQESLILHFLSPTLHPRRNIKMARSADSAELEEEITEQVQECE